MADFLKLLLNIILLLSWFNPSTAQNETTWYPKYHLAPQQGWMNDPNGLIYHNGYYHAFYQYNPNDTNWGLMHWGHARSTDMLVWEHLPIALSPSLPEDIDGIFSGSAISIDGNITIIYTGVSENGTRQRQMAATSANGIDFEKLGVIIDRDGDETNFRDPKVWWQDDFYYVVIGASTLENRGEVLLYKSQDFFNWTYEGPLAQADEKLGSMWECPDFFTLEDQQILVVNTQVDQDGYDYQNLVQTGYFVGSWTPGSNYTIEKGFREIDHGHDFYASQTFLAADGRRILMGWLHGGDADLPERSFGWAGMLTIPRELNLSQSGDLEIRPIREVQDVRVERIVFDGIIVSDGNVSARINDNIYSNEILVGFNLTATTCQTFGVELKSDSSSTADEGFKIYVVRSESRLFVERFYPQYNIQSSSRSVSVDLTVPMLSLDIFVDSSSVEVFVNDGQAVLSSRIYPNDDQRSFFIYGTDGSLSIKGFAIWDL